MVHDTGLLPGIASNILRASRILPFCTWERSNEIELVKGSMRFLWWERWGSEGGGGEVESRISGMRVSLSSSSPSALHFLSSLLLIWQEEDKSRAFKHHSLSWGVSKWAHNLSLWAHFAGYFWSAGQLLSGLARKKCCAPLETPLPH